MKGEIFLILLCLVLIIVFEKLIKQNNKNDELNFNNFVVNKRKEFLKLHLKNVIKLCKIAIIVIAIKIAIELFDNFISN